MMKIRLTKRLAAHINGVDLTHARLGEVIFRHVMPAS
jgi:hypothetical protein